MKKFNSYQSANNTYCGAPYNFVPLPSNNKILCVDEECIVDRNKIDEKLLSGEIDYKFSVDPKTHISIGDGKGGFFQDKNNKYVVPGSSMRGLIRTNAQILGFSKIDKDVDNTTFMFRTVTSGLDKKKYKEILGERIIDKVSVLENVKSGYIENINGTYVIYANVKDKENVKVNYYILSEKKVIESLLNNEGKYSYFSNCINHSKNVMQHEKKSFTYKIRNGAKHYKEVENRYYKPGFYKVIYKVVNKSNGKQAIDDVREFPTSGNIEQGFFEGYLVNSGKMKEKKAMYIIPKIDKNNSFKLSSDEVKIFTTDYNSRLNTKPKDERSDFDYYYNLPKNGEVKPVFYINIRNRHYFGFTPRLRLMYDYPVHQGIKYKKSGIDICESIFGSTGDFSYKSKVSFCDAVCTTSDLEVKIDNVVLSSPKATSVLDYIKQKEVNSSNPKQSYNTYNNPAFEINGIKQYWLHNKIENKTSLNNNDNIGTKLPYLINKDNKELEFEGKIKFENLADYELGLILWSIKLNDNYLNIGGGKPYGYGKIKMNSINVNLQNIDVNYSCDGFNFTSYEKLDKNKQNELINIYKRFAEKKLDIENIDEEDNVKSLLIMKSIIPIPSKIKYMSIDNRDYQNRKKSLDTNLNNY